MSPLVTAATRLGPLDAGRDEQIAVEPDADERLAGEVRRRAVRSASGLRSMTATVCPSSIRWRASDEPTRPHPTITTCTMRSSDGPAASVCTGIGTAEQKTVHCGRNRLSAHAMFPILQAALHRHAHRHRRRRPPAALQEDRPPGLRQSTPSRPPRTPPTRSCTCCCSGGASASAAFTKLVPIAIVVVVLLVIVVTSYRQTIHAYPSGGGSYVVSSENLGTIPSLVAGSSLLVDYILTVAVSVAGGVLAIRSAVGLRPQWAVPLCLFCVSGDDARQPPWREGVRRAVRPARPTSTSCC